MYSLKNMFTFFITIFFTGQRTITLFFAWKSFFKLFKITHIFIRIKSFLTESNMLQSNSWLKYLKSFLYKFLTKLSNEELKNWKLSIKINLLLMLKLMMYFQGLTNWTHGGKHARNVPAKSFSCTQNYMHVNHSKTFNPTQDGGKGKKAHLPVFPL